MINNKRKLSEDDINIDSKQTKKPHTDEKDNEMMIKNICERAKLLNNKSLTKEPHVIIICDDGEILKPKAGVLLWSRTLFTLYPPLNTLTKNESQDSIKRVILTSNNVKNTDIRFEMPIKDKELKCSYAFVTMVDALRLRVDMAKYLGINDDYSSIHLEHKEKVDKDTDPEDWLDNYSKMMKI